MKNFLVRAASGLTAAALFITAFLYHHQWSYSIAMMIVVTGCVYEFCTISAPARHYDDVAMRGARRIAVILTLAGVGLSCLINRAGFRFTDTGIILPGILFFYFVRELFRRSDNPFQEIGWNILPFIYILLPLMMLNYLYFSKGGLFTIAILFIIWVFDSMCYICGSLIGRTKLFERISPKKTIEGLVGGAVLTLTLVYFYDRILGFLSVRYAFKFDDAAYKPLQWLLIGLATMVFATLGDLVESQLKRSLKIKDSGSIMPGHGGFLDRLDAILVAAPFSVLAVWLIDHLTAVV